MEVLVEIDINTLLEEAIQETINTFDIMKVENIKLVEGPVDFPGIYLVSSIGFVGDYTGLISIYASGKLAIHIAECMLGSEVKEVDEEVRDALGEVTNLIVGTFKAKFGTERQTFKQSIPSVIDGKDFGTNQFDLLDNKLFCCKSEQFTLYVQLNLKDKP